MGNFLVITTADGSGGEAERLFLQGLETARCLKNQEPHATVNREGVYAASFPRQNGSGSTVVVDPETGSWLLAIGTWVHTQNYGSGAESHLLRRYLEVGEVQLGLELEGFFVVVVWDARTEQTIVLTDIIGSCHCYIRTWKNMVALSSSTLILASLGEFNVDPVGAHEFLSTGVMYEDRTFYCEVRKLGPASVFRFARGMLSTTQPYWRITDISPESLDGQLAVTRLEETLISAARRVGCLFPNPVCDLTGGYDSRALVTAFLSAQVPFSTTVSGPVESPDVRVSSSLAQTAGLPHLHLDPAPPTSFVHIKRSFPFTDGEYDLIEYARILEVHLTLSESFDISLNGSFGEVARGYWWELLFPYTGARRPLDGEKLARLRYAAQNCDGSLFLPELRLDLVAHFTEVVERINAELAALPNTLQMDHSYLMMRMQRWQGRIASSTNQLWPCLSLFLFRSVLETMLQAATHLRRRSLLIRHMIQHLQSRLAEMPLEHGYPAALVTWSNFFRFWPLPVYYGRRVLSKAKRVYGSRIGLPAPPHGNLSIRMRLWQENEVQELLRPDQMELLGLLDPARLKDFLRRSQQPSFPFDEQWARLLSLEYTLRVLGRTSTPSLHSYG